MPLACRVTKTISRDTAMAATGIRQCSMSLHRSQDTVNVYGLGEIFQVFAAESLHMIALTQPADGLWTDQELTGLGSGCQTCR